MSSTGPNPYLRTKILTASPEELRLMLFDGGIKFAKLARQAMDPEKNDGKPDFEKIYDNISRAQKIVLELSNSMKAEVAPEIVEKLTAIYNYIYRRLMDASTERSLDAIDEAIKLLGYERETWVMLMQKTASATPSDKPANPTAPTPTSQQTALSAYSQSA